MENFTLNLIAADFKDTTYLSSGDGCAIEKAIKRVFGADTNVSECVEDCLIRTNSEEKSTIFKHVEYCDKKFDKDMEKSISLNFDNTIVRKIKFTKF